MTEPLLSVRDLQTTFVLGRRAEVARGRRRELRRVSRRNTRHRGRERIGQVRDLAVHHAAPPGGDGQDHCGRIMFRGRDLASLSEREMRAIRGREIGMIFRSR